MKLRRRLQTCRPSFTHPAEVALGEGHILALPERVVVQDVVIVQQQQLGGVLAVALLPTPPQAPKRPAPACRDTQVSQSQYEEKSKEVPKKAIKASDLGLEQNTSLLLQVVPLLTADPLLAPYCSSPLPALLAPLHHPPLPPPVSQGRWASAPPPSLHQCSGAALLRATSAASWSPEDREADECWWQTRRKHPEAEGGADGGISQMFRTAKGDAATPTTGTGSITLVRRADSRLTSVTEQQKIMQLRGLAERRKSEHLGLYLQLWN